MYAVAPLGFTLRESKMLHAMAALAIPLSAAAAMPIWKLAGKPVAAYAYPCISPSRQARPSSSPMAVTIAGELHARPDSVGKVA